MNLDNFEFEFKLIITYILTGEKSTIFSKNNNADPKRQNNFCCYQIVDITTLDFLDCLMFGIFSLPFFLNSNKTSFKFPNRLHKKIE